MPRLTETNNLEMDERLDGNCERVDVEGLYESSLRSDGTRVDFVVLMEEKQDEKWR